MCVRIKLFNSEKKGSAATPKVDSEEEHSEKVPPPVMAKVNETEDAMMMEAAKEKFFFGAASLKDMEEMLVKEGDFATRNGDNPHTLVFCLFSK